MHSYTMEKLEAMTEERDALRADLEAVAMDKLIRDLEAATEGSRELDRAIFEWMSANRQTFSQSSAPVELSMFTRVFDAALTLVPEGYGIEHFMIWPGEPSTIMLVGTHLREGRYWHEAPKDGRWRAEASTPALALCIAALKARQATSRATATSGD